MSSAVRSATAASPLEVAKTAVANARRGLDAGDAQAALAALAPVLPLELPPTAQQQLARLAVRIADQLTNLPTVRIAFGADATVDDLVALVRLRLLLEGMRLNPMVLPFGTWPQQVHDPASMLYRFEPDLVWLFTAPRALRVDCAAPRTGEQTHADAQQLCTEMAGHARHLMERTGALVVVNNLVPPAWRVLGNLDSALPGGVANTVQCFNTMLPSALPAGAAVFDLAYLASSFGLSRWEDARGWCHSKHPFALDAHGLVAEAMARLVLASKGRSRKCVVLDLDNTLWGGVVGDDGVDGIAVGADNGARGEAYARFQTWLKALTERGVLLAVCSKNDEQTARGPFEQRSGMVLTLADFAAFRANWQNKADNLRDLASELNLGLDSFVFVDDNPAERALVRRELPQVAVPELPEDPADYIEALARGRWFETLGLSDEDRHRARSYRENAERSAAAVTASDLPSYLADLAMRARWSKVDGATVQRFTQLVNKTNQFHLTTTRYVEARIAQLMSDDSQWLGQFALADRFGDHGIIAATILAFDGDEAWIDTWAMSCRVFSRTMEQFIFAVLIDIARSRGCRRLNARYLPTPKNGVVRSLYAELGGTCIEQDPAGATTWRFDLRTLDFPGSPFIADVSSLPP